MLEHAPKDEVGESALIETVMINGVPGEYIQGNWREIMENRNGAPAPVQKIWDNNINYFTLKWYASGFFYQVHTSTWSDDLELCTLTKEDVLAIAQSLK